MGAGCIQLYITFKILLKLYKIMSAIIHLAPKLKGLTIKPIRKC